MERIVLIGPPGKRVHTPEGLVEISANRVASVSYGQVEYLAERKRAGFLADCDLEKDHGVQEAGQEPEAPEGEMNNHPQEQPGTERTVAPEAAGADKSAPAKQGAKPK